MKRGEKGNGRETGAPQSKEAARQPERKVKVRRTDVRALRTSLDDLDTGGGTKSGMRTAGDDQDTGGGTKSGMKVRG